MVKCTSLQKDVKPRVVAHHEVAPAWKLVTTFCNALGGCSNYTAQVGTKTRLAVECSEVSGSAQDLSRVVHRGQLLQVSFERAHVRYVKWLGHRRHAGWNEDQMCHG
eukprot:4575155-Amphidinium_carterae.1